MSKKIEKRFRSLTCFYNLDNLETTELYVGEEKS